MAENEQLRTEARGEIWGLGGVQLKGGAERGSPEPGERLEDTEALEARVM